MLEGEDAEVMALVWIEYFDDQNVPWPQWDALYRMAQKRRTQAINRGLQPLDIDAESLALCWPELKNRIHEAEVRSGRVLPEMAASDCPRCLGVGGERVFNNETGQFLGRKAGTCDHRPIEEHEWLSRSYEQKHAEKARSQGVESSSSPTGADL